MEEYRIVQCSTRDELEEFVNTHLKTGWKCQGGILYVVESYGNSYMQAITKVIDGKNE